MSKKSKIKFKREPVEANKTFLIWFHKAVLEKKIRRDQQQEVEIFFKSQGLSGTETLECYDSCLQKY